MSTADSPDRTSLSPLDMQTAMQIKPPCKNTCPTEPCTSIGPDPGSPWFGHTWEQLEEIDQEGRVVVTDHGGFVLFNVYGPNVNSKGLKGKGAGGEEEERAEERLAFKMVFYQVGGWGGV